MNRRHAISAAHRQRGIALIEAMVAVLIFAFGVLGIVAMGGTAMASQSDARVRTDAAALAAEISGLIALNVNRNPHANIATSLAPFGHRQDGGLLSMCAFAGTEASDPDGLVAKWVAKVNDAGPGKVGLPGAIATSEQILVTPATNRVDVTVCWKTATDSFVRHHTLVTYIN